MPLLFSDDRGQTILEYVLSLLFIALIIILAWRNDTLKNAVVIATDNIENSVTVDEDKLN